VEDVDDEYQVVMDEDDGAGGRVEVVRHDVEEVQR